jgi:hypothetical protein
VFSPDGARIARSARHSRGRYTLGIADFVDTPEPHLENIRSYTPGDGSYCEPGSFTKRQRQHPGQLFLGTDWYAMRANGENGKRLTTMNVNRSDNPQNTGRMLVAGTVAVTPAGDLMLGDVQDSLIRQTGLVKLVRFICR